MQPPQKKSHSSILSDKSISISAIFKLYDYEFEKFVFNSKGAEYLAAFSMAVNEINNKTDGIHGIEMNECIIYNAYQFI